jgi:hypothetical protein
MVISVGEFVLQMISWLREEKPVVPTFPKAADASGFKHPAPGGSAVSVASASS